MAYHFPGGLLVQHHLHQHRRGVQRREQHVQRRRCGDEAGVCGANRHGWREGKTDGLESLGAEFWREGRSRGKEEATAEGKHVGKEVSTTLGVREKEKKCLVLEGEAIEYSQACAAAKERRRPRRQREHSLQVNKEAGMYGSGREFQFRRESGSREGCCRSRACHSTSLRPPFSSSLALGSS